MPTPSKNIRAERIIGTLDASEFNISGNLLISGNTQINGGLTANTISATTYQNLPISALTDGANISITGSNGNYTISVTGSTQGGGGEFLPLSGGTVTGSTIFTNGLSANTVSATTYFNLPTDVFVTGGTYSAGTITFTNTTGGTFNVTGLTTGSTSTISGDYLPLSGGTVTGNTTFTSGLTANTISATTLVVNGVQITGDTFVTGLTFNTSNYDLTIGRNDGVSFTDSLAILASDLTVTGGTYNPNTGVATFTNNTGGTFNVTGFLTGFTDTYVTGSTYNDNTFTFTNTSGGTFQVLFNSVTGLTSTGTISSNTISATTYQNLPVSGLTAGSNISITGSNGNFTISFTGQTGSSFTGGTVSGATNFTNGLTANTISATTYQNLPTDIRVTGATYNNNTFTYTNNTGGTFNVLFNTVTGLTVNGNLTVTGNTSLQNFTGRTGVISAATQNVLTVIGSGNSTTSPIFSVQGSSGELFSVSDSLTGSLFSVNDISGLPILEVFSDNTILWGSYLAPSLNTTTRTTLTAGTNTVYSIPTSAYTGAFFEYTLISSGATGARAGQIMSIWSGTTANFTETTTTDIGTTAGVSFTVAVSGNNAVLSSSATTAGWTLKTIVRSI